MRKIIDLSAGLKENQFIIQKSIRIDFEGDKPIVTYDIGTRYSDGFYKSMVVGEIYKITLYDDPVSNDGNIWFFRYNGKQSNIIMSQSYIILRKDRKGISHFNFRPALLVNTDDIISIQPANEIERKAYYSLESKYGYEYGYSFEKVYQCDSCEKNHNESIYNENWEKIVERFNTQKS